ncbi:MAG: hypothetical protein QOD26_576 [Betaproteobacteria bacterium]|jgi:hypothetical protein|nr:hypothetical protein [Betaproteobacteria bacterium]
MSSPLTASDRLHAIDCIMAARFRIVASAPIRGGEPTYWASRHGLGRGIHSQALREKLRLEGASDAQLCAELAELN